MDSKTAYLFRNLSLKKKLTAIVILVSGCALLLACLSFVGNDFVMLRGFLVSDIETTARVFAVNFDAAVIFDDSKSAEETLETLGLAQDVIHAVIFDRLDSVWARYDRVDKISFIPPVLSDGHYFHARNLDIYRTIESEGEQIGTLFIRRDLSPYYARLRQYIVIILGILLISGITIWLLTAKLQKVITVPIAALSHTAERVSKSKDFSLRAMRFGQDEIGTLTERFNDMLAQIQERDQALQHARDKLQEELIAKERYQQALLRSERQFRDHFDNAPDIYIILDANGEIVDINKRGLIVLGYEPGDVLHHPFTHIIHEEDHHRIERFIRTLKAEGKPSKRVETRLLDVENKVFWVSNECSVLRDEEGKLRSVRLICRDITDKKRLQEALERAQRLESAGKLAGQIAHDFNNLLGPLAAYPMLIREEIPESHPVIQMVDEMENAALKIADINQQLLALGRRGHYTMEYVHVNELITNLIASQPQFRNKNIHMDLDSELLPIKGGAAQLTRALANIMLNAVESVHDGGIITIRTRNTYLEHPISGYENVRRGEYVMIEMRDTGVGIKPELMDKIFDPFFTTKRMDRMRGSGLGLSVVHGIIKDHNGYISVESKPDEGAKFILYLPISRIKDMPVKQIFEDIRGGSESILIVDDDPMQRKVTGNLLNRLGYKVHSANSGEEALDFIKKSPQDLLILDMVMDGIDGTETYEQVIKTHPGQKAIMLSGYAKSKRVEKALQLGAGSFVPKPVSLKTLAVAVRKELDE